MRSAGGISLLLPPVDRFAGDVGDASEVRASQGICGLEVRKKSSDDYPCLDLFARRTVSKLLLGLSGICLGIVRHCLGCVALRLRNYPTSRRNTNRRPCGACFWPSFPPSRPASSTARHAVLRSGSYGIKKRHQMRNDLLPQPMLIRTYRYMNGLPSFLRASISQALEEAVVVMVVAVMVSPTPAVRRRPLPADAESKGATGSAAGLGGTYGGGGGGSVPHLRP